MRRVLTWLAITILCIGSTGAWGAAEAPRAALEATAEATHGAGSDAHHALPAAAVPILQLGPLVVTNSMLVVWGVGLGMIALAQLSMRRMALVPKGLQNFVEWMVESLYDFLEGILGRDLVKKTFWFFATIFVLILFTNWVGLFPGVGTMGWGHSTGHGFMVAKPLFRGGNADLNMTGAMAMVFFVLWCVWAIQANGVGGFLKHLFVAETNAGGFMKVFLTLVFLAVGVLEVVSILFRPVALSLRLYGNIFAGENILETMITLVPWAGWAIPLPFYFLELLVGLVQALVFCLLTAVFTALICEHGGSEHKEHADAGTAH